MKNRFQFQKRVKETLNTIDPEILAFNQEDFWIIQAPYEYLEYYSQKNQLFNMALTLPLSRGIHNGSYRKSSIMKNGKSYRLPYVIHCLMVCKMLANLSISLSKEEEDILLASALCHDMIEDVPFPNHGKEMITDFHLDPRVYETVRLLSKRKDFTKEEELAHFHGIESNELALLVKLSDRGNNVEDLYNMSCWKVHEYVGETKEFFLPMISYGLSHYPNLVPTIEILQDKIVTLTEAAEFLVNQYEKREQDLIQELATLQEENKKLRAEWNQLWNYSEDETI